MDTIPNIIAKGSEAEEKMIINSELWNILVKQSTFYGNNQDLFIGDKDGNMRTVPAKNLLNTV